VTTALLRSSRGHVSTALLCKKTSEDTPRRMPNDRTETTAVRRGKLPKSPDGPSQEFLLLGLAALDQITYFDAEPHPMHPMLNHQLTQAPSSQHHDTSMEPAGAGYREGSKSHNNYCIQGD